MTIALTREHRELARVVGEFAEREHVLRQAHACLDSPDDRLPPFWTALASTGWLGLHLPAEFGGSGFGMLEVAVVTEELGYRIAPGPYLSSVIASAIIADAASDHTKERWLPDLAAGTAVGAIGLGSLAMSGAVADVFVLGRGDDLVVVARDQLKMMNVSSLDRTRRVARVGLDDHAGEVLPGARARGLAIARALAASEAAGIAHACTNMASSYAKAREQFGRVIGSFMAVKHHSANMLVQAELATAAAWDGVLAIEAGGAEASYATAVAAGVAFPAGIFCSQTNIQVHGGIGYTWEHDAHLYMRRAGSLAALFGPAPDAHEDVFRYAAAGVGRGAALELPPDAETYRTEVRSFLRGFGALPVTEQRRRLVDEGYLYPHWPVPWGRGAGPVEQLVIDQEMAGVDRPDLGIGGWITFTLIQHGNPQQVERWVRPSLLDEIRWCQLFSEPDAGSDAAAIQTRASKVAGGWVVNGQKVWTSGAQRATHGFATVRTDPEAPKHAGVTMMTIGMQTSGVTVRPLRSITGQAGFNEVFFDDVFVPDDDVIGPINGGWQVARATLGNERVSIGSGRVASSAPGAESLVEPARKKGNDIGYVRQVGALLAESTAIDLINKRTVLRALMGIEPSPQGNITKLLNSEHGQRVAELAMVLCTEEGILDEGEGAVGRAWVAVRSRSIAGGTSEITRSQIGERLLGLPREPGLK